MARLHDETRHRLALVAVIGLATIPFLNKAFHIDDFSYLQISRQILRDPLRPYDLDWTGVEQPAYVFTRHRSPPLFNYILAAGMLLFGEREMPLHCLMSLFTAGFAVSMYALARRFTSHPLCATTAVVLNPLFVPGQNLMLDVPALAFGLGGLACTVWGTDRGSWRLLLAGGSLVGLAVVTKYVAIILIPLIGLYSWGHQRRVSVVPLLVSIVPLAIWSGHNLLYHGRLHIAGSLAATNFDWVELSHRFLPALTILGSGLMPILLIPRVLSSLWLQCGCLVFGVIMAGAATWQRPSLASAELRHALEFFVFLSSGLVLFLLAILSPYQARNRSVSTRPFDYWFLVIWFLASMYVPMRAPFIAVRHLLWVLAPAVLLVVRMTESDSVSRAWRGATSMILGGLGLATGWADMEFANLQRYEVMEVAAPKLNKLRMPMYYLGEYGFAYYCESVGIPPFPANGSELPRPFAVFEVVSSHPGWRPRLPETPTPAWTSRGKGQLPLNTMSHGVNFYVTGNTDLPWDVGKVSEVFFDMHVVRE